MDSDYMLFLQIMLFYAILSYAIFPIVGYHIMNKNYDYVGHSMILGCFVSIVIWFKFGRQMIKDKQTTN